MWVSIIVCNIELSKLSVLGYLGMFLRTGTVLSGWLKLAKSAGEESFLSVFFCLMKIFFFIKVNTAVGRTAEALNDRLGTRINAQIMRDAYLHFEALCSHSYAYYCNSCGIHPTILNWDLCKKGCFPLCCKYWLPYPTHYPVTLIPRLLLDFCLVVCVVGWQILYHSKSRLFAIARLTAHAHLWDRLMIRQTALCEFWPVIYCSAKNIFMKVTTKLPTLAHMICFTGESVWVMTCNLLLSKFKECSQQNLCTKLLRTHVQNCLPAHIVPAHKYNPFSYRLCACRHPHHEKNFELLLLLLNWVTPHP